MTIIKWRAIFQQLEYRKKFFHFILTRSLEDPPKKNLLDEGEKVRLFHGPQFNFKVFQIKKKTDQDV